jgi:hypothetical protein
MPKSERPAKGLCGCWNAINTQPGLDLQEDPMHGLPGHGQHSDTIHAWCSICSPGSVRPIEEVLGRKRKESLRWS